MKLITFSLKIPWENSKGNIKAVMKLAAICVVVVVGLMVQVSSATVGDERNFVSVQLQSNGVDGIFWQFIKPFLPGSVVTSTGETTSSGTSSGNSTGSSTSTTTTTNQSASGLNQSAVNLNSASDGSTIDSSVNQSFPAAGAASSSNSTRRWTVVHNFFWNCRKLLNSKCKTLIKVI